MTPTGRARLDPGLVDIDPRMAHGYYTDEYFNKVARMLRRLADEGYRFGGRCPSLEAQGVDTSQVPTGDIHAEMQCFTKREPRAIAAGVDVALAMLRKCTGWIDDDGAFHNTAAELEVEAVPEGTPVAPWVPAMKIRGRYRDVARLETLILGAMARCTRIATNTYELLQAAAGKPVFFFSARFDVPEAQAYDGYGYKVGVDRYNADTGSDLPAMVTTAEQGRWWGGSGGGTTSHSLVLAFLADTVESMVQFARTVPVDVPRVALVDTNNDCVGDSVRCATAMFRIWWQLRSAGRADEAERYRLYGVRCDTARNVRDVSVEPTGDPKADCGVVPRLVFRLRETLDALHATADLPAGSRDEARGYFQGIKIVVSGGFNAERIGEFEARGVPADIYGVGSAFLRGPWTDFTADVVRVRVADRWVGLAKVGRRAIDNPDLEPVPMD